MEVGQDLLLHVVVAVGDGQLHGAFAPARVEEIGRAPHRLFSPGELGGVVVAQDILHVRPGGGAADLLQHIEALGALGVLGRFAGGQQAVQLGGHRQGVHQQVFGRAGMHREAGDLQLGGGGVEVLVFDLAGRAAVHRVGEIGPEALHVEQVGAFADLLVGGEADAQLAVGQLFGLDALDGGEDVGDAGLVVAAQQGGAVGGHEGVPHQRVHHRELPGAQHLSAGRQGDVAAGVLHHLRLHVLAAGAGGGVHMGDQAQRGLVLAAGGGGQGAVDIAVLVHAGVGDAQLFHLLHQQAGQVELAGGGRMGAGAVAGGGVHPGVSDQAFVCAHEKSSPFQSGKILPTVSVFYYTQFRAGFEGGASAACFACREEKLL